MANETILIVDDDPDFTTATAATVESAGYAVATSNDGSVGLDLARSLKPDLIVLDVMMSYVLEGLSVGAQLNAEDGDERLLPAVEEVNPAVLHSQPGGGRLPLGLVALIGSSAVPSSRPSDFEMHEISPQSRAWGPSRSNRSRVAARRSSLWVVMSAPTEGGLP